MMYGYGAEQCANWAGSYGSSSALGSGWMVIPMMGVGFLLVVALVSWFVWTQRGSLGLAGPAQHGAPMVPMTPMAAPTAAENFAAERLARGEINVAEYREIIAILRQRPM